MTPPFSRWRTALSWLAAGWIAWEFFYYTQFKFNAAEGSVQGVFQPLADWFGIPGQEAVIRWGVALLEVVAATLVINRPTRWIGALLTTGLMSGAIFFHTIGPIGIDPYGDGAQLFKEANFTLVMALLLLWLHRGEAAEVIAAARR
jgi:uncharacterized membrane protein YphA (DoxX/SURF4 family)